MQLYSDFKWMIYCKARAGQTIQSDGAKEEEHVRRWLNVVGKYTKWILYFPSLHYLTSQWPPAWSSNVHTIYLLRWKKQTTSTGYCLNMSHSLNDDATNLLLSILYIVALLSTSISLSHGMSIVLWQQTSMLRVHPPMYVAPPPGWSFYNNLQLNCLHLLYYTERSDKCHCLFHLPYYSLVRKLLHGKTSSSSWSLQRDA